MVRRHSGIKSFGVWSLERKELDSYFCEINDLEEHVSFLTVVTIMKRDCAVKQALEKGELSPLRYESYQSLLASVSSQHIRR